MKNIKSLEGKLEDIPAIIFVDILDAVCSYKNGGDILMLYSYVELKKGPLVITQDSLESLGKELGMTKGRIMDALDKLLELDLSSLKKKCMDDTLMDWEEGDISIEGKSVADLKIKFD